MLEYYFKIALGLGVLGYFFCVHVINPGQIFALWGKFLRYIKKNWGAFGAYIAEPLGLCHKCMPAMMTLIYVLTQIDLYVFQNIIKAFILAAIAGTFSHILIKTVGK